MAKYEDGSYGSAAGIALIAKVLAGRCAMKYTRVAVGKGNIPDDKTPKTMTEPADYVMDAGVVNGCETGDGVVKFYSKEIPAADISTCIILFGKGGGGESDLTVATREQLGHVKIGNGIEVTEDGTISANAKVSEDQIATSDDTSEMLKEIYGE